ncbi:MAG: M13 family peptidase, partial [Prevotella sp.]|nr:M13 family peptidase [Prevotella sp.]
MKEIIPMLLLIAAPEAGMAQNKAGIRTENSDTPVSPSENINKFACGAWQKLNPLPSAYSRFGSFDQLQEDNNQRINGIIASLTQKK